MQLLFTDRHRVRSDNRLTCRRPVDVLGGITRLVWDTVLHLDDADSSPALAHPAHTRTEQDRTGQEETAADLAKQRSKSKSGAETPSHSHALLKT